MLTALLVAVALQASGADAAVFSSHVRGERLDFAVPRSVLQQTPAWSDADLSPPLPPRRAIQIAARQLRELMPDPERWRLSRISMRPIAGGERWLYIVEYDEPPPGPTGGITSSLGLVVLMDGSTVNPKRSLWPVKG